MKDENKVEMRDDKEVEMKDENKVEMRDDKEVEMKDEKLIWKLRIQVEIKAKIWKKR